MKQWTLIINIVTSNNKVIHKVITNTVIRNNSIDIRDIFVITLRYTIGSSGAITRGSTNI